jgi:hypothetical protein
MRRRSIRSAGALCIAIALVTAGCGTASEPRASSGSSPAAVATTSSDLILHGRLRCTAQLSRVLQAGRMTGLSFTLHNVTSATVTVDISESSFAFVLRAARGTTYDSTIALEGGSGGPAPFPTPIPAGASRTFRQTDVWLRWSGPVSIQPVCFGVRLPPLRTTVTAPGPPPGETQAIADVVAAAGHLFDKCRPLRAGVSVIGTIDPPSGNAPPMRAACSIALHREGGFWVAQTLALVPPNLSGVKISEPYERLTMPASSSSAEAVAWEFVDTANGALPVATNTADATRASSAMAPNWEWTGTRWEGPGGSRCGGTLTSGGSSPHAYIEFISACPS